MGSGIYGTAKSPSRQEEKKRRNKAVRSHIVYFCKTLPRTI
ncbi:hypothetical protein [Brunnivagina elsteri]|nr:hypothetical protein [Calothrix elsteri]